VFENCAGENVMVLIERRFAQHMPTVKVPGVCFIVQYFSDNH